MSSVLASSSDNIGEKPYCRGERDECAGTQLVAASHDLKLWLIAKDSIPRSTAPARSQRYQISHVAKGSTEAPSSDSQHRRKEEMGFGSL